mmetsp:Transcript_7176/g.24455  ORF Transcript_7176/g.24455 Transcript_7176/m.24455 type:complete len:218 (+) Transcript_7176:389-1042(+)
MPARAARRPRATAWSTASTMASQASWWTATGTWPWPRPTPPAGCPGPATSPTRWSRLAPRRVWRCSPPGRSPGCPRRTGWASSTARPCTAPRWSPPCPSWSMAWPSAAIRCPVRKRVFFSTSATTGAGPGTSAGGWTGPGCSTCSPTRAVSPCTRPTAAPGRWSPWTRRRGPSRTRRRTLRPTRAGGPRWPPRATRASWGTPSRPWRRSRRAGGAST